MELISKTVHMDFIKAKSESHFPLEEDFNITDAKPDVDEIKMSKGTLHLEECKVGNDLVVMRGILTVNVCYVSTLGKGTMENITFQIPFSDKIHVDGEGIDSGEGYCELENLTVKIINSRKFRVQALLHFWMNHWEHKEFELPVDLVATEPVERRKYPISISGCKCHKKDTFHIKEAMKLEGSYPNIYKILWKSIALSEVQYRCADGEIILQGDVKIRVLYTGEGQEEQPFCYETTVPFKGTLPCRECSEEDTLQMIYGIGEEEVTAKEDEEGEERVLQLDITMDLGIGIFGEEKGEILTDAYGMSNEIIVEMQEEELLTRTKSLGAKMKCGQQIAIVKNGGILGEKEKKALQILVYEGNVVGASHHIEEGHLLVEGSIEVMTMYATDWDEMPYENHIIQIPFQYTFENTNMNETECNSIQIHLDNLEVSLANYKEMEVKCVVCIDTFWERKEQIQWVHKIQVTELDRKKYSAIPGMTIYIVKPGDSLWNIGKRYYMSVDNIMRINNLNEDTIYPGQRLLLAKGFV